VHVGRNADLAKASGVTFAPVSPIESGTLKSSVNFVGEFARLLNVDLGILTVAEDDSQAV
jgi:transcriptional regulator with XRE-family HTH domain